MILRPKNRRKQSEPRWQLPTLDWRRLGFGVGGVVSLVLLSSIAARVLDQPIERIAVLGQFQRVSPVAVEEAVQERVRDMGLVSVQLDAVRRAVEQIPWVASAQIARSWPRALTITVTEQVAAARWGTNGLLNTRGELFVSEARHIPTELPQLSGPTASEQLVAQRYFAVQGRLVEAGTRITAMRLDQRGAWEFDLDNGITVRLGRRQVDERFERFAATALRLITQRATDIAYVDMRYTNGFAVGWRDGERRVATGTVSQDDNPDG
ncbi:MAG: cell division protein FtsQ/DivIB [Steroidobacteraceae bacterium]|nr:cell division protein FtsQ/DivIB [Steroidobacteraceae bacterium]